MISDQGTFEYEAVVTEADDGAVEGRCVSLQERRGAAPGLIGSTPHLRLQGDRLSIKADPSQLQFSPIWQYLSMLVPPIYLYLERLQQRRGTVSSAELLVPGLSALVKNGHTLRVLFDPNKQLDFVHHRPPGPDVADVCLFQSEQLVREWRGTPIKLEHAAR